MMQIDRSMRAAPAPMPRAAAERLAAMRDDPTIRQVKAAGWVFVRFDGAIVGGPVWYDENNGGNNASDVRHEP